MEKLKKRRVHILVLVLSCAAMNVLTFMREGEWNIDTIIYALIATVTYVLACLIPWKRIWNGIYHE